MTTANFTDSTDEPETMAPPATKKHIPGDIALWFFLMAELAVFGILIIGFALVRLSQPEMFLNGLEKLHLSGGIINTMVLLTGSYLAAKGVLKIRQNLPTGRYLIGAALTGVIYMVVKMTEYVDLFSQGYSLHYDAFFGFYFFATFFHFLHVAAGVVILLLVANWLRKNEGENEKRVQATESIASYWHMVDIVWIVLFPTLYLLK